MKPKKNKEKAKSYTSTVYCCVCGNAIGSIPYDDGPINSITCLSCLNPQKNETQKEE